MRFWILLGLSMSLVNLHAQTFQQLTDVKGRGLAKVSAVAEDNLGYIWFASTEGLMRYDGHNLVLLSELAQHSLDYNVNGILSIEKDSAGFLWFVGNDHLIFSLDPLSFQIDDYSHGLQDSDLGSTIWCSEKNQKSLFLGTSRGLAVLDFDTEKRALYFPSESIDYKVANDINTIYYLLLDKRDSDLLWLFTRAGLLSFRISDQSFQFHPQEEDRMANYTTTALWHGVQDNSGKIWCVGNKYGISYYDPNTKFWHYLEDRNYAPYTDNSNHIRKLLSPDHNKIWVQSRVKGTGYYDLEQSAYHYFKNEPGNIYSLQPARYSDFIKDSKGNFWIVGEKGVSYYNLDFQKVNSVKLPIRESIQMSTEIHTISWEQLDDEHVLVGSMVGDGLYHLNLNTKEVKLIDAYQYMDKSDIEVRRNNVVNPIIINHIFTTTNGDVYLSLIDGFFRYNKNRKTLIEATDLFSREMRKHRISLVKTEEDKSLWILLDYNKLVHVSGENNEIEIILSIEDLIDVKTYSSQQWIEDFAVKDDIVYIKTNSDLIKYNYKQKISLDFNVFRDDNKQFKESEGGSLLLSNNRLYLNSFTQGLLEINLTKPSEFEIYNKKSGLPSSLVYAIREDDNKKLWLGTANGLSILDPISKKVNNINRRHGMREPNFLHFWNPKMEFSEQGNLFFYGADYVNWIHQSGFDNIINLPQAKIASIEFADNSSKNNYNLKAGENINISYLDNYFEIHFSSGDYILPEDQQFIYKLDGFDDQWRTTNTSLVKYTKVPHGDYQFRLRAVNFVGNESENIATLDITIIPPYWKTWWFYLLLCLVFLGLLYCFYAFWRKQIKEKEKIKSDFQKRVTEIEMDALRAQMNPHFLFNSLNSIKNYALTKGPFETAEYLTKFSHLIRLILQNSKTSTIVLQDEIEALRLYIEIEDLRFEEKFDFEINIDEGIDLLTWHIPPLILQPYVENAIWHGLMHKQSGKGKLLVELKNIGNALICIIEDNGIGREMAHKIKERKDSIRKKSLGMKITRDRIELTNELYNTDTSVKIVDLINKAGESIGTRVIITIPILGGEEYSSTE